MGWIVTLNISSAIRGLQPDKADRVEDFSSDLLISGHKLFVYLTLLFIIMFLEICYCQLWFLLSKTALTQHWFKAKHSTTHCTFILQEGLDYYISNNPYMFLVLLDASRALDRI